MHPTASTICRPVEVVIRIDRESFRCLYYRPDDRGRPAWTEHRREAHEFRNPRAAQQVAAAHDAHAVPCVDPAPEPKPTDQPRRTWLPYKDAED